jgi:hypothetical protein
MAFIRRSGIRPMIDALMPIFHPGRSGPTRRRKSAKRRFETSLRDA